MSLVKPTLVDDHQPLEGLVRRAGGVVVGADDDLLGKGGGGHLARLEGAELVELGTVVELQLGASRPIDGRVRVGAASTTPSTKFVGRVSSTNASMATPMTLTISNATLSPERLEGVMHEVIV